MSRYVFSRKPAPELPAGITPDLASLRIRICTDGYPETGALYYEGTIRSFVIERLPHESLVGLLPELLTVPAFTYRPGSETLRVSRLDG